MNQQKPSLRRTIGFWPNPPSRNEGFRFFVFPLFLMVFLLAAPDARAENFSFKATNTTNSTSSFGVWGDGTYIYVADEGGGIDAYTFNGTSFTYKATNTTNSTNSYGVWGDGTYIYVADGTGGIDAYTFNGTAFTYKATNTTNSTSANGVWGDGTYIYVADGTGGIDAYTFNGTAFTYKATNTTNSTNAFSVWGDGTYIYVADEAGGIDAYTFNGTAFTYKATNTTNSTDSFGVWGDGTYIYVADGDTGGVDAYTFNGTSFTYKATNTTNSISAYGMVWGDGTYVYVADEGGGIDAYTFNGTAFTYRATNITNSTNAYGVWGDGSHIYVADGTGGIDAYQFTDCLAPNARRGTTLYNANWRVQQYCDGTRWIPMDTPKYVAYGATFDAASDYLSYATSFGTDSTQVTGSFWFRRTANGSTQETIFCAVDSGAACRFQIDITSADLIHLKGNGTGGGTLRLDATGSTAITNTSWHHVMFSLDLANSSNRYIYLDGVAETPTWSTYSNAVIDFTRSAYTVGAAGDGTLKLNGDLADLWIDEANYTDLSSAANRARFYNSGSPVYLGANGNVPTGSAPEVFFTGQAGAWNTNAASGTTWTVNGVLNNPSSLPGGLSCTHAPDFTFKATNATDSIRAEGVWGDGTYIYVADGDIGGIDAYTFNGTAFTYLATNTTDAVEPLGVWGDGTYVYVADWVGGIDAYTFNGTSFTYLATNSADSIRPRGVWGDGTYIYVADWSGGIDAHTFNGTSFTFKATNTTNSVTAYGVWGDGTYIYVADGTSGIDAYTFNGTSFTFKATNTTNSTDARGVWGDGTYIYVADAVGGIDAYTFNGTSFTYLATNTTNSTDAKGVWGDGTYIYVADTAGGIDVYSFNGTSFTYLATNATNSTSARGVWGDGNYIYATDWAGGIDAYSKSGFQPCSCASPTALEGTMLYNADYNVLQYCDGVSWMAMGVSPGTGGSGCSGPTGTKGAVIFNDDKDFLQYCDGTYWRGMGMQRYSLTEGLVGHWKLDASSGTSAVDSSGSGYPGTLTNGPVWQPSGGKDGGALRFDGTDDYVDVPYDIAGAKGATFSVAAWVKVSNLSDPDLMPFVSKYRSGFGNWRMYRDTATGNNTTPEFGFQVITSGVVSAETAGAWPTDTNWHHVVGVYDGSNVYLYTDGVLANSAPQTGLVDSSQTFDICIGGRSGATCNEGTGAEYVDGDIDDVRIYNRALSAAEVQFIYTSTGGT